MEPQRAQLLSPLVLSAMARRPSTLQMVKEALRAQDEKKGASVFTIKRFILAKYPTVDPIRLKYLLKQALSKGLSSGELVRPRNSSAVGATGTFMLAPKEPQHKSSNPGRGQAPKPGQEGTTKAPCAPVAGAQQRGTVRQQLTATKRKPKAKPVDAQPRAAVKPGSDGAKPPRAANHPQAPGTGRSRPPRAADHPQALGKRPRGAVAAEDAGRSKSDSSVGAGTKGPQKVPGGKSKGKVLKEAQQDAPKAQRGQGQARKPRVTPGAGQGEAGLQKASSHIEDRMAL